MANVLPPEQVARIHALLDAGQLTQRAIARELGVGRETVRQIGRGLRPDYIAIRRWKQAEQDLLPKGPFQRCPEGHLTQYDPCLICAAKRTRRERGPVHVSQVIAEVLANTPTIELELRPEQQARYEEVKAARE